MKAIKAYYESNDNKMVCYIYNEMLIQIDPEGQNSEMYKNCK